MPPKLRIEDMHKIARKHGGKCLSKIYRGISKYIEWMCSKGHVWKATPGSVKYQKTWCLKCFRMPKTKMAEIRKKAKEYDIECLSSQYTGHLDLMKWKCPKGHIWEKNYTAIKNGYSFCPQCRDQEKLKELHDIAAKKGGKCLAKEYLGVENPITWECKEGHRWETSPHIVKNHGSWCPKCGIEFNRKRMELVKKNKWPELEKVLNKKGGRLVGEYKGANEKHTFICKYNHQWRTTPWIIKKGHWCPRCSENISETITRRIFEEMFGVKFKKARYDWLRNTNGHKLELDGFSREYMLAFEYQGIQHYQRKKFFEKKKTFNHRKENDRIKKEICRKKGILLIEVPYYIDFEDIQDYIIKVLKKQNNRLWPESIHRKINVQSLDVYSDYNKDKLNELKQIAFFKEGKILSKNYRGVDSPIKCECSKGHRWKTTPASIIHQKSWCAKCSIKMAAKKRHTPARDKMLNEVKKIARDKGGKCLVKNIINNGEKIFFECSSGHKWVTIPRNVLLGHWCPECAIKVNSDMLRGNLSDIQSVARKKGGKCMSKEYVAAAIKLEFECSEGHRWMATPNKIKMGRWCPECAIKRRSKLRRGTLDEMQKITKERGGSCLSKKYVTSKTKLQFKCSEGHKWETTPNKIKMGRWCRECHYEKIRGKKKNH